MKERDKTKKQLTDELTALRKRLAAAETSGTDYNLPEVQYKAIIQASMDGFWIVDTEGSFLDVNQAYCDLIGYNRDELLTMKIQDVEAVETREETVQHLKKVMEAGQERFETRHRKKNGELVDIEVSSHFNDIDGGRLFVFLRDITARKRIGEELKDHHDRLEKVVAERTAELQHEIEERKKSAEAFRESEEEYRSLFVNMTGGFGYHKILVDEDNNPIDYVFLKVNNAFERYTGLKREEIIGKKVTEVIPGIKGAKPDLISIYGNVALTGKEAKFELYFEPFGKWYSVSAYSPKRGFFVALFDDITERRRGEQALRASEEKFHAITNTAADAILLMDNDGKITYWNTAAEKIFGYTAEEAVGQDLHRLLAFEKYLGDFRTGLEMFKKTGQGPAIGNTLEFIAVRKDRTEFPIEVSTSAIQIDAKWCAVGIVRDIAERKRTEEALRASEAELHDNYFTQSAINLILSESLEDVPLEKILQKALNMILAIPWLSFESVGSIQVVGDEPDVLVMKVQTNLPELLQRSSFHVPFGQCLCGRAALTQKIQFTDRIDERHELCYAGLSPCGHYATPILIGGKTVGVLNIFLKEGHIRNEKEEEFLRTVSDTLAGIIVRKRAEDEKEKMHSQLVQAQKMEAVGELAGGVAHDFNNILTAIVGYGSLLKMKMPMDDPLSSYAEHILSLSGKAANLTQSLLAFSRKQIMNATAVDINQIIKKAVKLLVRIIREDIEIKTILTVMELTVMADSLQIEQALINLATNARDAMPRGGELEIKTEIAELDEAFITTHGYGKTGWYALISVSDTGMGMDEMTSEKIFEPFFTTKEVGKGTGLGLAMVYGIIKQHDGFINVYSEPGTGTIFRIYLPLIQAKAEEMQPEVIETIRRGTETILLTDDNNEVRASTKALLENFGYRIIEATDGEDAISKFNRYKDEIEFVILDVIMPKKNGREAYEEIRKIDPAIKVIFTSGYAADILQEKGFLSDGLEFIHKPISPKVLLRKVRDMLDKNKE